MKHKAVLIGTGSRGLHMFAKPLLRDFTDTVELAAYFDSNILRAKAANQITNSNLPVYSDYEKMMKEIDPEILIITTKDSTHTEYIIKGLGKDKIVYSEKPVCTSVEQVNIIRNAVKKTKGYLYVTHNMRYGNAMIKIKEIIDSGVIGKVLTLNFRETLDRNHGADYFRRWHRHKENSGGLLIHKASHHFDVLNWFADSKPTFINARGKVSFYGENGLFRSQRCFGCSHAKECSFYFDLTQDDVGNTLYKIPESEDGYFRDGCVFDKSITTEDNASVIYEYENGIIANYTLNAFASYEGMLICIEGTKARLEFESSKSTQWAMGSNVVHGQEKTGRRLVLIHPTEGVREIEVPKAEGGHGGADPALREEFFRSFLDKKVASSQMAGHEEALQAVLIGLAANISIAENGRPIHAQELLQ